MARDQSSHHLREKVPLTLSLPSHFKCSEWAQINNGVAQEYYVAKKQYYIAHIFPFGTLLAKARLSGERLGCCGDWRKNARDIPILKRSAKMIGRIHCWFFEPGTTSSDGDQWVLV